MSYMLHCSHALRLCLLRSRALCARHTLPLSRLVLSCAVIALRSVSALLRFVAVVVVMSFYAAAAASADRESERERASARVTCAL